MADMFCKSVLKIVVAQMSQAVGFDSLHLNTLEVLTDLLERFLLTAGKTTHSLSEQCGRNNVTIGDVEHCFNLLHVSTRELNDYIQQMDQVPFPTKIATFPMPKKSNFQFPSQLDTIDPNIPSYLPPLKQPASEPKPANVNSLEERSRSPLFTIAGKDELSDESNADGYASDDSTNNADPRYLTNPEDIPVVSGTAATSSHSVLLSERDCQLKRDNSFFPPEHSFVKSTESPKVKPSTSRTTNPNSKNDEPLWVKQHAAKLEHMSPRPNKPYVKSTSTPTFPSKNTMKSSKHETPSLKSSPWDSPLFSNPKFLSSKPDKKNVLKTPGSDKYKSEEKPAKIKKTSITSRIAEVDKLLQDPIIEKNIPPTAVANIKLEKSPVGSHVPVVRPYVESPPKQSTESSLSVKTESVSNMLFASPKHMDDAIDAVLHRVSKEAEEAELMKFSHLIQESSSSGENSDVEVSHKTEELLQLEQRGFHHHHDDGSPVRPPLTPSPAPSNNSIIIDQDIAFTPPRKSSYREVPSLLIHTPHTHLHPDASSERKCSTSSHSSILSHGVHEETNSHDVYEPPPSRKHSREPPEPSIDFTPTYHKKSKKDKKDREHNRSKSVKKSKHKDKEKKRSTSHERREVKPIVKDKAVEKLVLKKSKFNSPKLHKEREVTSCSFQPERLPLPKLSASIPAPLILNKEKKKEKKEKKKKKEKEMKSFKHVNQTVSHQPKEEITPIPKLTFKMTPSDKKVSIVKKHKRTPSTDDDLNDEDLFPPPPKKKTPEVKKEPKQVERKLITQTISVDHGVGVVLDADGNRVWICPGCKKPDDGSPMIGCDKCDGWYHWPCVDIVKEPPENEEWFCINCRKAQKQKGKKKQKTKY